jgi:hypothetical protein
MNGSTLQFLVMGFGVLILALCLWGVLAPERLLARVTTLWSRGWSLWLAVGIRLLLGWSLVQVAAVSRCPMALTVLGWIAIAAAVALVLVGRERVGRLITWGTARPTWLLRAWCVFGLALGAFIVWAVA